MLKNKNSSKRKLILFLYFIITFIKFLNCASEEPKVGKIIITDGLYLANEYQIISTNKNNPRSDSKSKICVISNREDYESVCKPFVKIYSDKWV